MFRSEMGTKAFGVRPVCGQRICSKSRASSIVWDFGPLTSLLLSHGGRSAVFPGKSMGADSPDARRHALYPSTVYNNRIALYCLGTSRSRLHEDRVSPPAIKWYSAIYFTRPDARCRSRSGNSKNYKGRGRCHYDGCSHIHAIRYAR